MLDTAALTGESTPRDQCRAIRFSGCINVTGQITVQVEKHTAIRRLPGSELVEMPLKIPF